MAAFVSSQPGTPLSTRPPTRRQAGALRAPRPADNGDAFSDPKGSLSAVLEPAVLPSVAGVVHKASLRARSTIRSSLLEPLTRSRGWMKGVEKEMRE